MMSKTFVAVAAAVVVLSGGASATNCGWFNEACCNIPDNNPNIGDCLEARNVCWEGKCMKCGTNGMIKCPSTLPALPLDEWYAYAFVQVSHTLSYSIEQRAFH
jgi:hypothetical protein